MLSGPGGRLLLCRSADLADQNDRARAFVCGEELERFAEGGADDRIAANAEAGRLTDPRIRH